MAHTQKSPFGLSHSLLYPKCVMNDPTAMQYDKAIDMHKAYALQTESGSQYKMILAPKMLRQIPRNHYNGIHI